MKIDGRKIAEEILKELKKETIKANVLPTLLVILVGENPASISYIRQKQKAAEFTGFKVIVKKFERKVSQEKLEKEIGEANKNPLIHGIIVQLPLFIRRSPAKPGEGGPSNFVDPMEIIKQISASKDVDGFIPNSPFTPPVSLAVLKILAEIKKNDPRIFNEKSRVLVLGRGFTAGKPIAATLKKKGYQVTITHSKTANPEDLIKKSEIIISCVGKPDMVRENFLKKGAIVIGVGLHRDSSGKLVGDFNEEKIAKVASFYTPTPGGIGPINVACLMENLVKAAVNMW